LNGSLVPPVNLVRAMSIEEAGRQLGISRATAYRLIQRGEIGSVLIDRRRVVPELCLRRFLLSLLAEQLGDSSWGQNMGGA
jgi:excisionase family DNA binding protein